ncbi:hypothetical protein AY599_03780 [Leptolyngbya valderiana BDU 20041]|nr:hypothetical protein AY599_03780 [Leptolyngbya valderiana BDU 20041]
MPPGANVVCDTPISHLRSATPAVVMTLNRKGITTVGDLLAASFDEVAYQLDSFDDAEVLIDEAKQAAAGDPAATAPPANDQTKDDQDEDAKPDATQEDDPMDQQGDNDKGQQPKPQNNPQNKSKPTPPSAPKPTAGQVGLATAMQAVLSLDGGAFASMQASSAAAQRLAAAALIIQHGGGEDEAVAAGLLDTIDSNAPCVDRKDASVRFGEPAVDLLERAELLLTVPMSPSGKPSNVHAKLVEVADASALLVATCGAVASARAVLARYQSSGEDAWTLFKGGRDFAVWYFGSICKALGPALKKSGKESLSHELWSVVRALEASGGEDRKAA